VSCQRILRAVDHYDVIGVPRSADEALIKLEFRKKAREVHPDKNSDCLANEAFKRLQKAYEVLSNSSSRKKYDQYGEDAEHRPTTHRYSAHSHPQGLHPSFLTALVPVLISFMLSLGLFLGADILFGRSLNAGPWNSNGHYNGAHPWEKPKKKKQDPNAVVHLSRSNADDVCGTHGKHLCVVVLTSVQTGFGEREQRLVENLRSEVAKTVQNSRGQSLQLKWTTVQSVGRWSSLLPPGASLPWVVVLKPSRATGLRVAAMPVPPGGGKKKGRLSSGVPDLLAQIALGEAKFDSVGGSVSALFRH